MNNRLEWERKYRKTERGRASMLLKGYKKADIEHNRGECTLTIEDIIRLWKNGCYWCGEKDWTKLGVDRLDNTKPHIIENCVCSCLPCNVKKAYEYFKENKIGVGSIEPITVYQFDSDGKLVNSYESINEAARKNNLWYGNIRNCCIGINKTTGGFYWSFDEAFVPEKNRKEKKVIQYTKDMEFIAEYESITEAAMKNNMDVTTIIKNCQGKIKRPHKYIWKYKE